MGKPSSRNLSNLLRPAGQIREEWVRIDKRGCVPDKHNGCEHSKESAEHSIKRCKSYGDLAHGHLWEQESWRFVPSSSPDASMCTDVALCALGDGRNPPWDILQKMIHGSKTGETSRRLPHTGIKHVVPNRIRLEGQGKYLDRAPGIVIAPVMSLDAMKNWDGGAYDAVVMVGKVGEKISAVEVCRSVQMTVPPEENNEKLKHPSVSFNERYSIATQDQVEEARLLLEHVLFGLADSFYDHLPDIIACGTPEEQEAFNELQETFTFAGYLIVPKKKAQADAENPFRVRLVSFGEHKPSDGKDYENHPAPDPLFLAIRAGVTWSSRHGQKLLAAGERQDDDGEDDDGDELDDLAVQQHLAFWAAQCRPETWDDVARGLGQEGGSVA